jgi:SAM-dependent methyltransferase
MNDSDHRQRILDQFSRQAAPFSEVPAHADADAMELLIRRSKAGPEDEVLDAGCGPGLVACALAPRVRSVVGADLTPAMLEKAQELAQSRGLGSVAFVPGDMERLPFSAGRFVLTRYTFHHLLTPAPCPRRDGARLPPRWAGGGRGRGGATGQGLRLRRPGARTLAASFPEPGGAERVRVMVEGGIGLDRIGIHAPCDTDGSVRTSSRARSPSAGDREGSSGAALHGMAVPPPAGRRGS